MRQWTNNQWWQIVKGVGCLVVSKFSDKILQKHRTHPANMELTHFESFHVPMHDMLCPNKAPRFPLFASKLRLDLEKFAKPHRFRSDPPWSQPLLKPSDRLYRSCFYCSFCRSSDGRCCSRLLEDRTCNWAVEKKRLNKKRSKNGQKVPFFEWARKTNAFWLSFRCTIERSGVQQKYSCSKYLCSKYLCWYVV